MRQFLGLSKQQEDSRREKAAITVGSVIPALSSLSSVPSLVSQTASPQPAIGPQPMANAPVQPKPIPPVGPSPSQGIPLVVPPLQESTPVDALRILKEMGLDQKIENLKRAGNPPEIIGEALQTTLSPGQRKWLDAKIQAGEAKPLPELVKDYLTIQPTTNEVPKPNELVTNGQAAPILPQQRQTLEPPGQKLGDTQEKTQGLQKGSLVFDEHSGISGDLKDIRDKEALVNDNGKLHKVKTSDLLVSETPEKDLADLYNDLIAGIEKETGQDVSRNVEFAGYDPEHNELVYHPYLGGVYVYDNISEEDAKLLTSLMTQRKSSGENFIGAWEKGTTSPIGAALSALIKKLQKERGGKGKEYSRKFQTIYNAHEPAQLAAKKKKAEEDRKRKKK